MSRSRTKLVLDSLFDLAFNNFLRLASQQEFSQVEVSLDLPMHLPEDVIADMLIVKDVHEVSSNPAMASFENVEFFNTKTAKDELAVISRLLGLAQVCSSWSLEPCSCLLNSDCLARASATHQKAVEMLGVQRL